MRIIKLECDFCQISIEPEKAIGLRKPWMFDMINQTECDWHLCPSCYNRLKEAFDHERSILKQDV